VDVTPFLDLSIAPRAVFDRLDERRTRPRFMVPEGDDWRAVTWGAFADEIRAVACWLSSLPCAVDGDLREARAAIFADNSVSWMSAALATQAAGGVMMPVYPASTADQAAYMVEHSDAVVVFVGDAALLARVVAEWPRYGAVERIVLMDDTIDVGHVVRAVADIAPALADVEAKLCRWSQVVALGRSYHQEAPHAFAERMNAIAIERGALMLYTSGTTGRPKGVPLTHRNVAVNGRDWLNSNQSVLEEQATDVLWLPMSHIFGFGEACLGNTLGFMSYMSSPARALDDLRAVKPSVFMSVPAYWEKLAAAAHGASDPDDARAKLNAATGGNLRFCLSGGAGLKREVKELFRAAGMLIIEGYGLTECSPTLTLNRPDAFRFDAVGKALPSVELRLAEDGEILARGPSVFAGYHKDEVATREAFTSDGWFKTGDIGRMTPDGFLQIIDRKKEILVTAGGKNVPPANIELRFADEPLIQHVVVYGDGKKFLTAAIWLDAEAVDTKLCELGVADTDRRRAIDALVGACIDRVNAQLARFEQIRKHCIIDTPLTVARGLLTSTLKVRRKKVYEAFAPELEALYD
jgi:long-chain acyl-CoA synthetase